jgi:hypothetical protein
MLKGFIKSGQIEAQVEEELSFHCEMLAEAYREQGLSEEEAHRAMRKRFGDVERVSAECIEISRRSRPVIKLLKLVLLLTFITGVWLRTRGWGLQFNQVADMLMATGVLGQLLVYLKGLRATSYSAVKSGQTFSLLGRGDASSKVEAYDAEGRTPVERLVADRTKNS